MPKNSSDGSRGGDYIAEYVNAMYLSRISRRLPYMQVKEKAAWTAQAHTLRALYYLQLIKRYGGVPIFDKPLEIGHDFSLDKRAKFSEVVTFIPGRLRQSTVVSGHA